MENEGKQVCKSVFKSGESTTTEREFTDKWVELVNTLERHKTMCNRVKTAEK